MGKAGPKAKYPTPDDLEKKADEYFEQQDKEKAFYTVAGLAHFLGFQNRERLAQMKKAHDEFAYVIDRTKLKMEEQASNNLLVSSKNIAGTIFYLKNNFAWKDVQEKDININVGIQAMTDQQLDERLKIAFKELLKEIGMEGLKQLGFDGEADTTRNEGDDPSV